MPDQPAIVDPIANRLATEYGASQVTPPDDLDLNPVWRIEAGADPGEPRCRLLLGPDGTLQGAWDPDYMLDMLREEGLI